MRWIISYLLGLLLATTAVAVALSVYGAQDWQPNQLLLGQCALIGSVAGVLYCLRAIYVNTGLDRWDSKWTVWYYLRPLTSAISGFASCIFLQAGLLALSSQPDPDAMPYGYLAAAFIAGYNVDFFMKKIEQVARELWGIEKSRASEDKDATDFPNQRQEDDQ